MCMFIIPLQLYILHTTYLSGANSLCNSFIYISLKNVFQSFWNTVILKISYLNKPYLFEVLQRRVWHLSIYLSISIFLSLSLTFSHSLFFSLLSLSLFSYLSLSLFLWTFKSCFHIFPSLCFYEDLYSFFHIFLSLRLFISISHSPSFSLFLWTAKSGLVKAGARFDSVNFCKHRQAPCMPKASGSVRAGARVNLLHLVLIVELLPCLR